MTDNAITAALVAAAIAVVLLATIGMIIKYRERTRDAVDQQDAKARAEHNKRCHCVPRVPTHELQVWLQGRDEPVRLMCDPDEAHRAHHEIKLQAGLYAWRSEFIYDPLVSVLGADGSLTDVVVPQVQAVTLIPVPDRV